jgi:ATP-dependent Clp protease ATP-binding subunit ClpA
MLKPALARGDFSLIGATTTVEFQTYIQRDEALERRFTPVKILEPSQAKTLEMLLGARFLYERAHVGVCIPLSALSSAVYFAGKYITSARYFPDKAVDLIDDSAAKLEFSFDRKGVGNYLAHESKTSFWRKVEALKRGEMDEAMFQKRQHVYCRRAWDTVCRAKRSRRKGATEGYKVPLGSSVDDYYVFNYWEFRNFDPDLKEKSKFWRRFDAIAGESFRYRDQQGLPQSILNEKTSTNSLGEPFPHFFVPVFEVALEVYNRTQIPLDEVPSTNPSRQRFGEELRSFEDKIREQIVAQDEAILEICLAVIRSRTGIRDYTKPVAVLFFAGPTGVGKTEIAKVVATYFFRSTEVVYRFDMSEFADRMGVSKLIGSPPGYQAMHAGGILTNFVRRRPFSLLIFDEFEKAHFTVYDMLLSVFDDARLSDALGRFCDFRNTMLISTSNSGAALVQEVYRVIGNEEGYVEDLLRAKHWVKVQGGVDQDDPEFYRAVKHLEINTYLAELLSSKGIITDLELRNSCMRLGEGGLLDLVEISVESSLAGSFRPEFVNRFDRMVFFESFQRGDMVMVSYVMFSLFRKSLISRYLAIVNSNYKLLKAMAWLDMDLEMGARPVRRAFLKIVEDPLASLVLRRGRLPLQSLHVYSLYFDWGLGLDFRSRESRRGMKELEKFVAMGKNGVGTVNRWDNGQLQSLRGAITAAEKRIVRYFGFPDYVSSFSNRFGDVPELLRRPGSLQMSRVGLYVSDTLTPGWLREFLQVVVGAQVRAARL